MKEGPGTPGMPLTIGGTWVPLEAEGSEQPRHEGDVDRYEYLGELAQGAMGVVHRVRDRKLGRVLAMKVMRWRTLEEPVLRAQFAAEARTMAKLRHPGIVTAEDCGELPDGRRWFTMREVSGTTLDAVVSALHDCSDETWGVTEDGWTLQRVVDAWARVCDAVAYAHSEEVLHRDLKPANLMVGRFGEVLVMDWGVAREVGAGADSTVSGTPAYMAPEQARGEGGPPVDAYALGAVLYTVLTGRFPYVAQTPRGAWQALLAGPPPPVQDVAPRPLPAELVAICEAAMAREPDVRPTVVELGRRARAWVDGVARRARGLALVAEADVLHPRVREAEAEADRLLARSEVLLAALPEHAPDDEREEAWDLGDQADALRHEAAVVEAAWLTALQGALSQAPDLPEARRRLAQHYRERVESAEARRDLPAVGRYETLLRHWEDGQHRDFLDGTGAVSLVTDPPGAEVRLHRMELQGRRLVPVFDRIVGRTPLRAVPLPRGSWLLTVHKEDHHTVRYPVVIGREEHWHGRPPEGADPGPIWLPPQGALAEDDRYVPAGWFQSGGDDKAADGLPRRRLWVPGFIAKCSQVTHQDYAAFLDTVGAHADDPLVPRSADGAALYRRIGGRFELEPCVADTAWVAGGPVGLVDHASASAFAQWRASEDGLPWRLPHDQEWEKAARGVDGRVFPWGDHVEAAWAKCLKSQAGAPSQGAVDDHPVDTSVYGLRGMAGNMRTWCRNGYSKEGAPDGSGVDPLEAVTGDYRMIRGGAWTSNLWLLRAGCRFASQPEGRFVVVSLRLVRSLPDVRT